MGKSTLAPAWQALAGSMAGLMSGCGLESWGWGGQGLSVAVGFLHLTQETQSEGASGWLPGVEAGPKVPLSCAQGGRLGSFQLRHRSPTLPDTVVLPFLPRLPDTCSPPSASQGLGSHTVPWRLPSPKLWGCSAQSRGKKAVGRPRNLSTNT